MKLKENIGGIISEARKKLRMTQQELAEKVFVTDKAISNWEKNKNTPDEEILQKLEQILNIELFERKKINSFKATGIIIVICLLIVSFFLLLLFYFNNYNSFIIYDMKIDTINYSLADSYLLVTPKEIIINMNKIENTQLPLQPEYKVDLFYYDQDNNENIICSKNSYDYFFINLENNRKTKKELLNNLHLKITYIDYDNNTMYEIVKLELSKKESSSKIFYKKNKVKKIDNNILNLLINNNYHKISNNTYEKNYENSFYKYNLQSKKFYYEGIDKNYKYYAIKENNGGIYYVIKKDNTIIEYKLPSKSTGNTYTKLIEEKISEFKKINEIN